MKNTFLVLSCIVAFSLNAFECSDAVKAKARDFIDNDSDGHIIPLGTYKIDTTLQTIEANTFTDSTGTITT